jgi:hypothetical protein
LVAAIHKTLDMTFEISTFGNIKALAFHGKISETETNQKEKSWPQFSGNLKDLFEIGLKKVFFKTFRAFFKEW